jgi:hypothetical protein
MNFSPPTPVDVEDHQEDQIIKNSTLSSNLRAARANNLKTEKRQYLETRDVKQKPFLCQVPI